MIAITFALPAESSRFLQFLQHKQRRSQNGITTVCGTIDNHSIEVLHTGVGKKTCQERIARFIPNRQFDLLISAGFAGALIDDLHAGDLLIAKNFSTIELGHARSTLANFQVQFADLYTAPGMLDSANERRRIQQASGAAAVDMETAFIARVCTEHSLPMLSLRVISDTPNEPFPAPPDILFDIASQRTNMMKLAAFLLTRPNRIPRLIQFARRIERARRTLANALVDLIRNLPRAN